MWMKSLSFIVAPFWFNTLSPNSTIFWVPYTTFCRLRFEDNHLVLFFLLKLRISLLLKTNIVDAKDISKSIDFGLKLTKHDSDLCLIPHYITL